MGLLKFAFLIPLLPLVSFLVIAFITRHIKGSKASAFVAIAFNTASFVLAFSIFLTMVRWVSSGAYTGPIQFSSPWIDLQGIGNVLPFHLEVGVLVDPLSTIMAAMVTFISTLIMIYSVGYMAEDKAFSLFFSYLSLFVFAMLTLVFSNNFLLTFVGWELVGLCSYLLIGFWYSKRQAAAAAIKAFIVTRTGDVGFLIGIITLYWAAGSLNFVDLGSKDLHSILTGWLSWGVPLLIFCGAVGKSAQFPLHVWLPDAMEGPTPVSALIHAATMVAAGVYLVARSYFLFVASPEALMTVAWIGAFTAFLAATMAIVQWDSKRVLAYSTVSQLGYMMLALGAGPIGFVAAIFHLLTHAFFKALLFLGAGSIGHSFHAKENSFDMHHYGGLAKKLPVTYLTFMAGTLAITGVPLFAGFFSKDEILGAIFHSQSPSHLILWGLAVLTAFMTSTYMFRMFFLTFHGGKEGDSQAHESPGAMLFPLIILSLFAIGGGWFGWPGHSWIAHFFDPYRSMYHIAESEGTDWFGMSVGTGVFVLGYLTAFVLYARGMKFASLVESPIIKPFRQLFVRKWYMDDFWNAILQVLAYRFSSVASWIDTNLIDGTVRTIGAFVGWVGQSLRSIQTGLIQAYAFVIVCSIIAFIFLMEKGVHWWTLQP